MHFSTVRAGRPLAQALPFVGSSDLAPSARLVGPVEPLQIDGSGALVLRDARERGVQMPGEVAVDAAGTGR